MTTNEMLTLGISGLALVTSVATILVGQFQQDRQLRNTARDQLAAIVGKLIDARHELSIIEGEFQSIEQPDPQDAAKFSLLTGTLNHKLTSLARQASELLTVKGVTCFDVELIAIANALDTAGDIIGAEQAYRSAVQKSSSDFFRSLNLSFLAEHLMRRLRLDEGRLTYSEALAVLRNDNDHHRAANARIYQSWMGAEMSFVPPPNSRVRDCYLKGKSVLQEIAFVPMREACLKELTDSFCGYQTGIEAQTIAASPASRARQR